MKSKEKNKTSKTKELSAKEKEELNKKERIKSLVKGMKNNEYFDNDNANSIINCFIQQNFRPLSINEIVSIISDIKQFETDSQKVNVRHIVMNSLKNEIFRKNGYKFELVLEKTVNYLISFLDSRSPSSNSNLSRGSDLVGEKHNVRVCSVFNFPENQNETIYLNSDENQQKSSCSNVDDTSFTFGEQSQIKINKVKKEEEEMIIKLSDEEIKKINKKNISDEEFKELENKVHESYIREYELIFDRNNYFAVLEQSVKNFFKSFEKNDYNLKEIRNNIYSLIEEYNLKIKKFTEDSSLFNEQKKYLLLSKDVIHDQFKFIKIILNVPFISGKLISSEKDIFKTYVDNFKKLFDNFQQSYENSKLDEKEINKKIANIKKILGEICDNIPEGEKEIYNEFIEIVENIKISESIPVKVNINENIKFFYYYINEFKDCFSEIESN